MIYLKKITALLFISVICISGLLLTHQGPKINASGKYPEKFDLRTSGLVSPVRSQGQYGTCWAFSALGSLETQILKTGTQTDLSEWHLAYFSYNHNLFSDAFTPKNKDDIFNEGGYNNIAAATLTKWIGPVNEDDIKYDSGPPPESSKFNRCFQVQDIYNISPWISERARFSTDTMKELLYNENSLSCSFSADTDRYYNPDTAAFYCNESDYSYITDPSSHSILIIGWDDNYSRQNFKTGTQPENNGAWLAKNSWGTSSGNDGFCWISYEDCSLREAAAYFGRPADTYQNNYYYDNYGWSTSLSADLIKQTPEDSKKRPLTGYMSNIFTARLDEMVSAVSFYTIEPGASYEIQIYTQLNPYEAPYLYQQPSDFPVTGTAGPVTSGTEKYAGYHTVELQTPVRIHEGEQFSAVVKITNPSSPFVIPIDASVTKTYSDSDKRVANVSINDILSHSFKCQSYISRDGTEWFDLYRYNLVQSQPMISYLAPASDGSNYSSIMIFCGHTCVKAFTRAYQPLRYDINDNGTVSTADAVLVKKRLLDTDSLSQNEMIFYDVNNDNKFNATDYISIVKYIMQ